MQLQKNIDKVDESEKKNLCTKENIMAAIAFFP
jgi:hypothetical protein